MQFLLVAAGICLQAEKFDQVCLGGRLNNTVENFILVLD